MVDEDPATSESSLGESGNMTDDEELLDYEETPSRTSMDINMVYYLPVEFRAVEEGEIAQINFGPKMPSLRNLMDRLNT